MEWAQANAECVLFGAIVMRGLFYGRIFADSCHREENAGILFCNGGFLPELIMDDPD